MTVTTAIHILRTDGTTSVQAVTLPDDFGYADLRAAILAGLDQDGGMEHVAVLYEGQRRDMFVREDGHGEGLPRNDRATDVYRNNWMTQHPGTDPESIPWIAGPAVLFPDRLVWS